MTNEYYNRSGWPATGAAGQSAPARAELALVEAGFNKLPTMTGNANKAVLINSAGNALTVSAGTFALAVNFATAGSGAITLTSTGATNVTLPTTGTLATLAGTEELTNKTLTASVAKGTWTASGTWTVPAHTLGGTVTLNGQTFSGAAVFDSTLAVTGSATLSSTLAVTGSATLSSTLAVTGSATLSSTLAVTGAATLSSTLAVTGAATLSSTLAVTSTFNAQANTTLGTSISNTTRINGTVAQNGAPATNAAYYLYESTAIPSSGGGAYGFRSLLLSDSSATNSMYCFDARIYTPNSAFTLTDAVNYFANVPSKGAASTITNWYGFRSGAGNIATNNYGFYSGLGSASTAWAFFGAGTAQSAFGGNVRIGSTTAPTVALDVTGAALISSTLGVTGATTLAAGGNAFGGTGQANIALYLKETATVASSGGSAWGLRSYVLSDASATIEYAFEGAVYAATGSTVATANVFQASGVVLNGTASLSGGEYKGFYSANTNATGATLYAFHTNFSSSGAGTKWAFYHTGTANSAFNGNVRIGSTSAPTVALDVTGAVLISSTLGVTGTSVSLTNSQNATTKYTATNINTGTGAEAAFEAVANGTNTSTWLKSTGSGYTGGGTFSPALTGLLFADSGMTGGLSIAAREASADVRIYAGGIANGDLVATFADDQSTTLTGTLTVGGAVTLSSTLAVTGAATFTSTATAASFIPTATTTNGLGLAGANNPALYASSTKIIDWTTLGVNLNRDITFATGYKLYLKASGFSIEHNSVSGKFLLQYNGTTVLSIDSSGNLLTTTGVLGTLP